MANPLNDKCKWCGTTAKYVLMMIVLRNSAVECFPAPESCDGEHEHEFEQIEIEEATNENANT